MATESASTWVSPALVLAERLGPGIAALWAMLFAVQIGTHQLALSTPIDDDRPLSGAAWNLQEALEELEWVCPELATDGVAIDLGPPPFEHPEACREALAEVLDFSLGLVVARLGDTVDVRDVAEDVALARTITLLASAQAYLTGGPIWVPRRGTAERRWHNITRHAPSSRTPPFRYQRWLG